MTTIPLTKGYSALIDDADAGRVSRHKWCATVSQSGHVYAVRSDGNRLQYLHRFIVGAGPDAKVDHRDGDTLNCTRGNLRSATTVENNRNRRPPVGHKFKGIRRVNGRWVARIGVDGKRLHLGRFDSAEQAALAYNEAAIRLHGRFARLNEVVAPAGFEPATPVLEGRCSIQLSYGATRPPYHSGGVA